MARFPAVKDRLKVFYKNKTNNKNNENWSQKQRDSCPSHAD